MKKNSNESGASMIEIISVLGVIGCISVGVISSISNIHGKVKVTQAHKQVKEITKAMRDQFSAYVPTSISAESLEEIGVYKKGNVTAGKAYNVFGTEMKITVTNDDNPYFTFVYKDISPAFCFELLQADWGLSSSSGLKEISVTTHATKSFVWDKGRQLQAGQVPLPPTQEDTVSACTSDIVDTATVSWQYYL